ncbi:PAS sensor protein [Paenibacillus sp. CGMCC 1.18879]|uniref:PAS sensor protein n=1 Tax=Paenibacillus sp. CGMCC 1.18879 TaxID=2834466 RepID=UPI001CAA38E7|nr:PAS sensor protein [Paenibacillus sp. CGMCC 1.18879]MBY9081514.1 PAS sensor protein [Paenibacillus sp. CGMCC 1.18879]
MKIKKLIFTSVVGLLLLSGTQVVGAEPVKTNDSPTTEAIVSVQQTGRILIAYSKLSYPTISSLPTQFYYNQGGYAGWIPRTYVTSFGVNNDWWSVTFEGTVYPI